MPPIYSVAMPGVGISQRVDFADNKQIITNAHQVDSDTKQIISALMAWDADARQVIFISPRYSAATPGLAISRRVALADARQVITNSHQVDGDAKQIIFTAHGLEADTKQIIHTDFEALADFLARIRSDAFYFNGEHLWDHGGSLLTDSNFDGIPETKEITLEVPGRPGVYYIGTEDGERTIKLRLGFNVPTTHQAKARELAAWLTPRAGESELKFDAEPDKVYYMRISRKWQHSGRPLWVEFDVEFRGSDPYAYGSEMNYAASGSSPISMSTENPGSIETPTVITLTPLAGQITDVAIEMGTQSMNIAGPFTVALTIDTAKMTAVTGGANAAGQVSGGWLTLPPGENTLNISWVGGDMTIDISFRPRWL